MADVEGGNGSFDRGPAVFATCLALMIMSTIFFAMRITSRYFIVKQIRWDDIIMSLGWLFLCLLSASVCVAARYGLGKHDEEIPSNHLHVLRASEFAFTVLYNIALGLVKASILAFYIRVFTTQTTLRWISWATLIVVTITAIVCTFINIFQCSPISAAWKPVQANCINLLTEFICASPVNIVTNLIILATPLPVLSKMRIPTRQKTILIATFGLGIFTTVIDVVRIYYLQRAISRTRTGIPTDRTGLGGTPDFAYNGAYALMWSAVEVCTCAVCGNIPLLKPILLRILPAMLYDPDGSKTSAHESESLSTRQQSPTYPDPTAAPLQSLPEEQSGREDDFSAMEFLTVAEPARENFPESMARIRTNFTASTTGSSPVVQHFGFVNMTKPKSMLRASNAESLKYCSIVAILFFLWGFSYGLLSTLNDVIASINGFSTAQTLALTASYFGIGYLVGAIIVGEWILRRDEHTRTRRHQRNGSLDHVGGYKATFMAGLAIYGTGTIVFWPVAVTGSWGGFVFCNALVGAGLAVLEVGANSFMVLCGPRDYADARLLIAQGVQAVASVLSALLAQKIFFAGIPDAAQNSTTLVNVQWTYLGITLFCAFLCLFFYYMPLPEVTEAQLESATRSLPVNPKKEGLFGLQLRTWILIAAVAAQFNYLGAQECNAAWFRPLILSVMPSEAPGGHGAADQASAGQATESFSQALALSTTDYINVGHSAFAISRFLAAYLCYLSVQHSFMPKPRTILTVSVAMCILFALLSVVLRPSDPNIISIPVILGLFAEGPLFPLIFSQGLRGQGNRSKRAAAAITAGASGPPAPLYIMYAIINGGGPVQSAFVVVIVLQVLVLVFPLFLEFSPSAKLMVDPSCYSRTDEEASPDGKREKRQSTIKRPSLALLTHNLSPQRRSPGD